AGGQPSEQPDIPRPASMRAVEEMVARAVAADALWLAGATLVVAVSGGADSLCLLGALLALQASPASPALTVAPGELVVATLDHGLRGAAGAADARWVAELAASLELRCVAEQVETRAWASAQHLSLEDAARRLRYRFLRRVAAEVGAARIALGHTLDDQAETILLRLLRGSGLDGLAGMRPLRGDLARPLLGITHAQAVAYCAARGWLPREDLTNRDERYLRNRVRRRLLPLLEAYNPNVRRTLARNASLIADDLAALEAATDGAWAGVVSVEQADRVEMRLGGLRELSSALRRRVVRRAAQRLLARPHPPSPPLPRGEGGVETPVEGAGGLEARHIALIERFIAEGRTGGALSLPDGLRATLGYETLSLARVPQVSQQATEQATETAWRLPIPGAVEIAALGWRVLAAPLETPPGLEGAALPPIPRTPPLSYGSGMSGGARGELRVYLDADRIASDALTVRAWRPGDRFRPLGMAREKKLQDVLSDAKVPRELRHRLPVVCLGERIVWVAGVRIADEFKLTPATSRALALQAEPLRDDERDLRSAVQMEERER
ncbi:MAG TPA: tRNA lysidine(34) synthetase TilS, partial [Ktedonobacterales bacterium]|nr:tRNA lysidine(34) synthetase TilS [Ktedonobacterales bacterium]